MGLLKALGGAAGGVLADQWKEYFYCDALPANVIAVRGKKKVSGRSSNTKGDDNIITQGSIIAVAEGQCMIIVEQGKVVDVCAEAGEFKYDASTEPSIFAGNFGKGLVDSFKNFGKRFTFGGEAPKDQRVYYLNMKEMIGNKYGTPQPVPFRVVDERAGIDIDVSVRCFGEYSWKLSDPLLFYKNVCGNVNAEYTREEIEGQLKSEFLTALQPAFAKISAQGVRYSQVPGHTMELAQALKEVLSEQWQEYRGIEIVRVGVSSISATEEDEKMLKELQRNAAFRDPTLGAAYLVGAQGAAMQAAANNQGAGGAAMAFMGMNMAGAAGGMNAQNLYAMGAQNQANAQAGGDAAGASAGNSATSAGSWKCSCGATASGKFCPECGKPKPADEGFWTCSCGAKNKGKFCQECGAKKPAGIPQYKCDKCGWEPAKGTKPPKFCPECGDPFDDGDIVN
ncbi:MAG: SPFH domain-containing protein [Treponema sp.]|nr:SPFH domain-containing protein [Treponema sp.]